MEQRGRENNSWEELVEKTIEVEVKTGLQPSSYIRDMDQYCPRGNCLIYTTTTKSQASAIQDPRDKQFEKISDQDSKRLHFSRSKNSKAFNKNTKKEKKKK